MLLEKILNHTRQTIAERKRSTTTAELERRARAHHPRGFAATLRRAAALPIPAIIAEIKKASPSRGLIRADFDPATLAATLASAGAAALSVLTDEPFFQGSLQNLELASAATTIPCLRKDFILDEFQILEARASSADAILLIATALTDAELRTLNAAAHGHGLDVLCEVHTAAELDRVAALGCDAYGVNNRDLVSFEVHLETSEMLAAALPREAVRIAESGLNTAQDLARLKRAGYHAFLIGESLMRHPNPAEALATLLNG